MGKSVYIAEKPSVAREFAKALKLRGAGEGGFIEDGDAIVTWCLGHLVTMSYPEAYDPKLKKWSLDTLPFMPKEFLYEVIPTAKKQFAVVKKILTRGDVDTIYVCTDSGREGEYIYRLVSRMAKVRGKTEKRVWIDSQTENEILRGIREAKDISAYDNLASSAYLRAKEDYLMGINFSRLLTLRYGDTISGCMNTGRTAISAGRVMTCVLGMVVRREREIRDFVKTPYYRVVSVVCADEGRDGGVTFEGEWRAVKGSRYFESPALYKENGFKEKKAAEDFVRELKGDGEITCRVVSTEKKPEKKYAPLLFNLAELQNECAKRFKISPNETLSIAQELYEKKLVTYPRTDARVLSTPIAKEIGKNLSGLLKYPPAAPYLAKIRESGSVRRIAGSRYTDDSKVTDHYALIPTGQGLSALERVNETAKKVYDLIVRRFLSVFYPPALYQKLSVVTAVGDEKFFTNIRVLKSPGYLEVSGDAARSDSGALFEALSRIKAGDVLRVSSMEIKEAETVSPKRYNSGSIILAMENAGQLIEDEELRAQIKGSGIGTSATRAEILSKLFKIKYLSLNKKTQVIIPTLLGEMVYDTVNNSIPSLLNPELTASWEKGLSYVADGKISSDEYMQKLGKFISSRTEGVKRLENREVIRKCYKSTEPYYRKTSPRVNSSRDEKADKTNTKYDAQ